MILQKFTELFKKLESLDDEERGILGIHYPLDRKKQLNAIKRGKWDVLFFEVDPDRTASYGVKILPNINGLNWPVISNMPYMESGIEYSSMASKLIGTKLNVVIQDREGCEEYLNDWDRLYNLILPFYEHFGGKDDLEPLKEIVFNSSLWPKEDIEPTEILQKQKQRFLILDSSTEAKYLVELIEKLKLDDAFIPNFPSFNLGIYGDRIKSMISTRCYLRAFKEEFKNIENGLFLACQYTHGCDTESIKPKLKPNITDTCLLVFNPIEVLLAEYNTSKLSESIKLQPEFRIAEAMNKKRNSYNGVEHLEVAAHYDEAGEPLKAWTNLVSAGYWAGKNLPDAQVEILKQAISLCQRQAWLEAEEVLKYNLEILENA